MHGLAAIRVLVVDDEALVRESFHSMLAGEAGLEVVGCAANAADAVALAVYHQPDLVLLDVDLNGSPSFEVFAQVRARCPRSRIVFVSGFVRDCYIEFALDAGSGGYISKHEPPESFIAALREVAAGRQYFSNDVRDRLVRPASRGFRATRLQTRSATLSPRQREILPHIARGRTKRAVACDLGVTVKTIETHCETMMDRLLVNNRVELARYAVREGIIEA